MIGELGYGMEGEGCCFWVCLLFPFFIFFLIFFYVVFFDGYRGDMVIKGIGCGVVR